MTKLKHILKIISCCINSSLVLEMVFPLLGMALLDFDTVDHSILLMKLQASGLGDDIIRWFKSYLSERQQLVDVSGSFSSTSSITRGVPHWFNPWAPLLFNLR